METTVDFSLGEDGTVFVKTSTHHDDGLETNHRTTLTPGSDLVGQPQEVIDAAALAWTPAVISAYAARFPRPIFIQQKGALANVIDADVDAIYAALLGNREAEYALAEKEATAYRDAGYSGAAPVSVQAWATAKAQTATWATDDILAAAAGWRYAQGLIRSNRLALKEAARNAADSTALAVVQAQWAGFLAAIRQQLGL